MTYDKSHPLRVVTVCSGYDSPCLALKYLKDSHPEFEFDLVAWSEIEDSAIKAHNLLFPEYEGRNLGDMSKIEWGVSQTTICSPTPPLANRSVRQEREKVLQKVVAHAPLYFGTLVMQLSQRNLNIS